METNRFLYLGMILLLLIVDFSFVDSKANVSAKNDLDPQSNNVTGSNEQAGELGSVSDSNGAHKEKKNKGNQQNKLKESIDDGESDDSKKKTMRRRVAGEESGHGKKVKVSITSGGSDNLIVLKSGKGHCSLDIRHLIDKEFDNSQKSTYLNFMSPTPTIVVLAIAALLILAAGGCASASGGSNSSALALNIKV
ncbi:hypothetical protein GH714_005907 [Hevea brasiliensis]|uniref:Uncharacterized protein n=1 Tax=Hevea brasiliensis TaxID=3981 RepID=A0A6A6LAA9_HEVBR|nr:hypothetical protein GH714_005907 [Hevea brasiliensis]